MMRTARIFAATLLIVSVASPALATSTTCNGAGATIVGASGDDILIGKPGRNILYGNDGDDVIRGAGGDDAIYGEDGDDSRDGGAGTDSQKGNAGIDVGVAGESRANCES